MADIVIRQIEEGMTGRQVADLLYSNFLALVGAIGSGSGGDIPVADIEKGVTAYGWGDHSKAGYLKGITAGMVTGALGYTPMDEAAWTKANIKATLGIADWALASSKPTYTTKEVAEDSNLYFTDARAVAALAGVTDALAGDIGANATAIGVLQGYFTNGVAKSAAKLQTARKLWGQLFNGEADVTGALTGVTDITASGVLTIGKIKIGDGVIEWDTANGGFKVTGGLWATDYLSSKGVNTGASGGGGGGSSYQRLDTWDGYTSAKDGWVLSAKLGYGLKTTQDDILRQLADISGQGTNVTFTPALTSGTQIGTLTIDGEPVKMYAPSIPTTDIEKGVTAYGWGNHATMGYITASASITGNAASASLIKPTTGTGVASSWVPLTSYTKIWSEAFNVSSLGSDTGDIVLYLRSGVYTKNSAELCVAIDGDFYAQTGSKKVLHEGNYTDYAYSKTTIDSKFSGLGTFAYKSNLAFADLTNKPTTIGGYGITDAYTKSQVDGALGGYLPLSGGTMTGMLLVTYSPTSPSEGMIAIKSSSTSKYPTIRFDGNISWGYLGFSAANTPTYFDNSFKPHNLIHSGNIGSQSVASAAKLTTARTIWGQSFDGTEDVDGTININSQEDIFNAITIHNDWYTTDVFKYTDIRLLSYPSGTRGGAIRVGIGNYGMFNSMSFGKMENGDRYTPYMFIYSSGNVGIGTTSPQATLDVEGTFRASGAATFGSTLDVTGQITLLGTTASTANIAFSRSSYNYITFPTDGSLCLSTATSTSGIVLRVTSTAIEPMTTATKSVGTSSKRWGAIYGVDGDFSGTLHATTGIYSDGYVSAKGQNTSSDMRLKRVLEEVTLSVDEIAAAPAFRFAWKGGGGVDVGTSAQYWEKLVPDAVKRDDAGWRMMQYGNVAMVALISLARRVKELEEKLGIKN